MDIIEAFKTKKDLLNGNGVTEKDICLAEKELNLRFSDEYRKYLKQLGIAAYDGHELTGLTKTERTNVVYVTKKEKENNFQIPESWYVIEVANIDNIIIWQEKNGRIYVSCGEKTEEIFESLSEYILKM